MEYIVLDTNILLCQIRGNSTGNIFFRWYESLNPQPIAVISVVTIAEIQFLAIKHGWGNSKLNALQQLLKKKTISVDIGAVLVTTDKDFDHLDGKLLSVKRF